MRNVLQKVVYGLAIFFVVSFVCGGVLLLPITAEEPTVSKQVIYDPVYYVEPFYKDLKDWVQTLEGKDMKTEIKVRCDRWISDTQVETGAFKATLKESKKVSDFTLVTKVTRRSFLFFYWETEDYCILVPSEYIR